MNGKVGKLLRKARQGTKKGKRMWNFLSHSQRGEMRKLITEKLAVE